MKNKLKGINVILRPNSDSKDLEWKFPKKVLVRTSWDFVCQSEIVFWCTFDQDISKTFQYFKVWIKSKLKRLKKWLYGLKVILNTLNENFQQVVIRISWNFVCKTEIEFWCNLDQNISKNFQYFKVWIKSELKNPKKWLYGLKVILKI